MSNAPKSNVSSTPPPAQLPLPFPLAGHARFDTFEVGGNVEPVGRLRALARGGAAFDGCFLHGPSGVGRSHLLQAACREARGSAMYLPLADPALAPALLEGLESRDLVALDDVGAWLGAAETEAALLNLYHGLQTAGGRLLVSARVPAAELTFHYPDLGSRLRALPAYRLRPLADADKVRLLTRLAEQRGLVLAAPVVEFWLARGARDLPTLLADLERLDQASLAEQRRLTIPLLKQVLGL